MTLAPTYRTDRVTLHAGDCLDVLPQLPDASVHAVVCDPPYGLEFMGKDWDRFAPARTQYHGERADTAKNIRDDDTKPSSRHHVAYAMTRPTFRRCTGCGRREFSGTPCRCDMPDWTYEQPAGTPTRMAAYQAWCEQWARECLRVLRPGGHLLAFGGTRTYHRLACAIEDAGFEVRDSIHWIYGSGFPKSLDVSKAIDQAAGAERTERLRVKPGHEAFVGRDNMRALRESGALSGEGGYSRPWMYDPEKVEAAHYVTAPATDAAKQWQGWGTALKPAHEPIVVARKPLAGTVAANVQEHGTGALNIDGCRIATTDNLNGGRYSAHGEGEADGSAYGSGINLRTPGGYEQPSGRWPTNLVLGEPAAAEMDEQSGTLTSGILAPHHNAKASSNGSMSGGNYEGRIKGTFGGDSGGASRFFPTFRYEPKADADERVTVNGVTHPTVKPLALTRWLVRLVTPPGGVVLDPFAGTGTTLEAALLEHCTAVGIERDPAYVPLAVARLNRRLDPLAYHAAIRRDGDPPSLFDAMEDAS